MLIHASLQNGDFLYRKDYFYQLFGNINIEEEKSQLFQV